MKEECSECRRLSTEMAEVQLDVEILRVTMNKYLYQHKPNNGNFETTTTANEDINLQTSADFENNFDERNIEINKLKETINSLKDEITNVKEERDSLQLVLKIIIKEKDVNLNNYVSMNTEQTLPEIWEKPKKPIGRKDLTKDNESKSVSECLKQNRFTVLEVEDTDSTNETLQPCQQSDKDEEPEDKCTCRCSNTNNTFNEQTASYRSTHKSRHERVLLIGDSMIKNIQTNKIERAYRGKADCQSYGGATVSDLKKKIKAGKIDVNGYKATVLHIGTNDLVKEDAATVSNRLESLIQDLKPHSNTIALSSVIKRNDGRVPEEKISTFNNLNEELCTKLNVHFIDNQNIHESHLNGSKLHLNRSGDKVLGKNLCTYFRSLRSLNFPKRFTNHAPPRGMRREQVNDWKNYLNYVHQVTTSK